MLKLEHSCLQTGSKYPGCCDVRGSSIHGQRSHTDILLTECIDCVSKQLGLCVSGASSSHVETDWRFPSCFQSYSHYYQCLTSNHWRILTSPHVNISCKREVFSHVITWHPSRFIDFYCNCVYKIIAYCIGIIFSFIRNSQYAYRLLTQILMDYWSFRQEYCNWEDYFTY